MMNNFRKITNGLIDLAEYAKQTQEKYEQLSKEKIR